MAIDSAEKRRSAAGVGFFVVGPGVTPNASQDGEWRQQSCWGYSGIAVGGAISPPATLGEAGGIWPSPAEDSRSHRRSKEWRKKAAEAEALRAKMREIWEYGTEGRPPEALEAQDLDALEAPPPAPPGLTEEQQRQYAALANELTALIAKIGGIGPAAEAERIRQIRDDEEAATLLLLH